MWDRVFGRWEKSYLKNTIFLHVNWYRFKWLILVVVSVKPGLHSTHIKFWLHYSINSHTIVYAWACWSARHNAMPINHTRFIDVLCIYISYSMPDTKNPEPRMWKKWGNVYPRPCNAVTFGVLRFLKPLFQSSQKLVRSSLRVLASN